MRLHKQLFRCCVEGYLGEYAGIILKHALVRIYLGII
jgi:hypothetical protein